jgi:4-hydroxy-4-methyl-2-oxoglutarate aldolase
MKPVIVRNIERPEADAVRKLDEFGVATVHEAQGRMGLMLPYTRPIYLEARIAAPAVTVYCPAGDNLMIHAAIEICHKGDVLVVTTQSQSTDGMFGELLATSCQAHGITGVVIDAGVRDVLNLTKMQFPAFSKAISS